MSAPVTPRRSRAADAVRMTCRLLPELLMGVLVVLIVIALWNDDAFSPWFTWPATIALAIWLPLVGIPALADSVRSYRYGQTLLDLEYMDLEHDDHLSGVWMITAPCGHESWSLFAPGQSHPDDPFPLHSITPTATFSALDGPGQELPDDDAQTIEQIREWAIPWVEQVSGGHVVVMLHGWGAPYGPHRNLHEVSVFARVKSD